MGVLHDDARVGGEDELEGHHHAPWLMIVIRIRIMIILIIVILIILVLVVVVVVLLIIIIIIMIMITSNIIVHQCCVLVFVRRENTTSSRTS